MGGKSLSGLHALKKTFLPALFLERNFAASHKRFDLRLKHFRKHVNKEQSITKVSLGLQTVALWP